MTRISFFFTLILLGLLFSCSNSAKAPENSTSFSFDKSATILEWTAFKFTEKKGVKGTFDSVEYTSSKQAKTAEELAKSICFSIHVSSVNTDNPERDEKIKNLFFGVMKEQRIQGKVIALMPEGKAMIELVMNGHKVEVPATYLLDQGSFVLESKIDVAEFGLLKGVEQLNAACKELHTGTDGISKLWTEVELYFSTEFKVKPSSNTNS